MTLWYCPLCHDVTPFWDDHIRTTTHLDKRAASPFPTLDPYPEEGVLVRHPDGLIEAATLQAVKAANPFTTIRDRRQHESHADYPPFGSVNRK